MKYSVGDMFRDHFGHTVIIIEIIAPFSTETWMARQCPHYAVRIDGTASSLRWYDKDFDGYKNITSPVMKELYS